VFAQFGHAPFAQEGLEFGRPEETIGGQIDGCGDRVRHGWDCPEEGAAIVRQRRRPAASASQEGNRVTGCEHSEHFIFSRRPRYFGARQRIRRTGQNSENDAWP